MKKKDILSVIQKSKDVNLNEYVDFRIILEFLQSFENNFIEILNNYESSNVRFCDYYDESFNFKELTSYFKDNYIGRDQNEQYNYFVFYSIIKKCIFLMEALSVFDQNEILESFSDDIENITSLIKEFSLLNTFREKQDESDLNFDNHKYKLLFSGFSLDDITFLDKKITKSLVNKINNSLLDFDIVPGAEGVDHVRDKFNIPLLRVQLANDFRVSFIRKNGVTIILGVELKSGKDINYTRYDSIAKKIDIIYSQCELLNKGELPSEDMHYKVLEEIENKLGINNTDVNSNRKKSK